MVIILVLGFMLTNIFYFKGYSKVKAYIATQGMFFCFVFDRVLSLKNVFSCLVIIDSKMVINSTHRFNVAKNMK